MAASAGYCIVYRRQPHRGRVRADQREALPPAAGHLWHHLAHRGWPHDSRPHLQQQARIYFSGCHASEDMSANRGAAAAHCNGNVGQAACGGLSENMQEMIRSAACMQACRMVQKESTSRMCRRACRLNITFSYNIPAVGEDRAKRIAATQEAVLRVRAPVLSDKLQRQIAATGMETGEYLCVLWRAWFVSAGARLWQRLCCRGEVSERRLLQLHWRPDQPVRDDT